MTAYRDDEVMTGEGQYNSNTGSSKVDRMIVELTGVPGYKLDGFLTPFPKMNANPPGKMH